MATATQDTQNMQEMHVRAYDNELQVTLHFTGAKIPTSLVRSAPTSPSQTPSSWSSIRSGSRGTARRSSGSGCPTQPVTTSARRSSTASPTPPCRVWDIRLGASRSRSHAGYRARRPTRVTGKGRKQRSIPLPRLMRDELALDLLSDLPFVGRLPEGDDYLIYPLDRRANGLSDVDLPLTRGPPVHWWQIVRCPFDIGSRFEIRPDHAALSLLLDKAAAAEDGQDAADKQKEAREHHRPATLQPGAALLKPWIGAPPGK